MDESLVETLAVDKKMDESVKSGGGLDVSVSFGRFENDALSWEKWSTFSPNKYLDEVGSLSTPGSVAQKKAYFEAHYKKIAAAKKAEESEQEKSIDSVTPTREELCNELHVENSSVVDTTPGLSNGYKIGKQNAYVSNDDDEELTEDVDPVAAHLNGSMGVEENDIANALECGSSMTEETKEELNGSIVDSELTIAEESTFVGEEEIARNDSREFVEKASERKDVIEHSCVVDKGSSKLKARNIAQKVTPTKKDRYSASAKKSIVSPVVNKPQTFTPRYPKLASISTPASVPRSLKQKVNGSPLPKSKNISKKVAPTLHMSHNLGPTNSSASIPLTRKSLIMESMGDKDIVKRAFKSFQNRTNESSENDKLSTLKQVPSTALKPKVSSSLTPRRGDEGPRKDVEKVATPRSQSGTRSKPSHSRSDKSHASKNTVAVSPSVGLRSDDRAEKRKEFLKNLEAKSIARQAENAQRSAKSKDDKESEIKKLRQSLNFKAKPIPSFYRNQGKLHLEKETGQ